MENRMTKELWFKQRKYGWGWTPTTWQGWMSIIVALLLIYLNQAHLGGNTVRLVGIILALLAIGYIKGPKPRWQWGDK